MSWRQDRSNYSRMDPRVMTLVAVQHFHILLGVLTPRPICSLGWTESSRCPRLHGHRFDFLSPVMLRYLLQTSQSNLVRWECAVLCSGVGVDACGRAPPSKHGKDDARVFRLRASTSRTFLPSEYRHWHQSSGRWAPTGLLSIISALLPPRIPFLLLRLALLPIQVRES